MDDTSSHGRTITKEEFDRRARDGLARSGSFGGLSYPTKDFGVIFSQDASDVTIDLRIGPLVARSLSSEERQEFGIGPRGRSFTYHPQSADITSEERLEDDSHVGDSGDRGERYPYYITGLEGDSQRKIDVPRESIRRASVEELADIMSKTPPDGLMFYTGAGISNGGSHPVLMMNGFDRTMHLDQGPVVFLRHFHEDPEALAEAFLDFRRSGLVDISSPAHIALAQIVRAMPGASVFSENFDLKHEAEWSRLDVVHLGSAASHEAWKERSGKAVTLVTVALSHDDRAGIAEMVEKNPKVRIIALALPDGIPTFLAGESPNEAVLLGDCQETLPQLADLVLDKLQHRWETAISSDKEQDASGPSQSAPEPSRSTHQPSGSDDPAWRERVGLRPLNSAPPASREQRERSDAVRRPSNDQSR